MAVLFFRHVGTLVAKNLRMVLVRHPVATVFRAFVIPVCLFIFFSLAKYIFVPPAVYGIGTSTALHSLAEALADAAGHGRHTVVFYNGGLAGGPIDAVIDQVAGEVEAAGSRAVRLSDSGDLDSICRSSLRGVTSCYGAVMFDSSPTEGAAGFWKYAIRSDGSLGAGKIDVDKTTNDGEIYSLPFQHAIDSAIVAVTSNGSLDSPGSAVHEYPFTSLTAKERDNRIRVNYQKSIVKFLGVAFISGVIGICYHLAGFVATERETGMSTLLDAMMTTSESGRRWGEAQAARLLSYHLSFTILYLPGWLVGSAVVSRTVFTHTSAAAVVLYHLLSGLALASMAMFGASFFRRAQLSGVSITIIYLLLAIITQTVGHAQTSTVAVLSLLFAPCNYVYFMTNTARFERKQRALDLLSVAPNSPWDLPGIVLLVFLGIQIVVYPTLGAFVERYLHGTTTTGRTILEADGGEAKNSEGSGGVAQREGTLSTAAALQLDGFSKTYAPGPLRRAFGWLAKPPPAVHAVRELTLSAGRGQILVLLGANGSGKSTTLDAIAGTTKLSSGRITIDGTGGLGIAPQKNVVWDELTVEEHLHVFNRLKAPLQPASRAEIRQLIESVDLAVKAQAQAKTLSGGQLRKLQLGMMLTGGSAVCCVDEVSSGLDPLSRRKIWDILLAERGRRTIILTTHFLDEADLLADRIAVLSRGTLRAEGSSVLLKEQLGGGYRIHVPKGTAARQEATKTAVPPPSLPRMAGIVQKDAFDMVTYIAPSSALAASVIRALEGAGVSDYRFSGPTLEDVFLQLAEEVQGGAGGGGGETDDSKGEDDGHGDQTIHSDAKSPLGKEAEVSVEGSGDRGSDRGSDRDSDKDSDKGSDKDSDKDSDKASDKDSDKGSDSAPMQLLSGRPIGFWRQTCVLLAKRFTVFKHNWLPSLAALVIPVLTAGLVTMFITGQTQVGCSSSDQLSSSDPVSLAGSESLLFLVAGPQSRFEVAGLPAVADLFLPIFTGNASAASSASNATITRFLQNVTMAATFDDFNRLMVQDRKNVTPAGFWLGDASSPPTLAYRSDSDDQISSLYGQNLLNVLLANMSISTGYAEFNIPWAPSTGKSLQLLVYVCLACCAYPGFFGLYPNLERRRHVRGLEYSNGVRAPSLWLAYLAFDFAIVLLASALVTILFAALSSVWFHVGYLFIVFVLYGLASTLLSYLVSLFCQNQLSAYAASAASQAVIFLVYMIAYLCTLTYAPVNRIDSCLLVVHFVVSAVAPIGSVVRSLFVSLNLFSVSCDGTHLSSRPGGITLYGGPILYLILQSLALFGLLLWIDSGSVASSFWQLWRKLRGGAAEKGAAREEAADGDHDGHGGSRDNSSGLVVSHLTKTFGKNTAVDNVSFRIGHGEVFALLGPNGAGKSTTISMIRGDVRPDDGDVLVEGASVRKHLAAARAGLGVCPQFDAVDQMTVREHLRFYARVRGISTAADVARNVQAVLQAVGLEAFADRQALALSGGNKRKLSLGIALMGNPAVVLLDEPSSGLDAAAKRIMWKTLAAMAQGRSILLTTHSMEEADALAASAGILARRMLAAGPTDDLRARFGHRLYVHLVSRGAPHTPDAESERLRQWVLATFPGAEVESKTYHGQMRFAVPVSGVKEGTATASAANAENAENAANAANTAKASNRADSLLSSRGSAASAIGRLVVTLDEHREALAIEHFSVSPATLDQVFLTIVGQHNVAEEGYQAPAAGRKRSKWQRLWRR